MKDYAVYLIKKMQPFKSCTLLSVYTHFWQIFAVVLSGSLTPTPSSSLSLPAVNFLFIQLYLFSCAHCTISAGGEAARGAATRDSISCVICGHLVTLC